MRHHMPVLVLLTLVVLPLVAAATVHEIGLVAAGWRSDEVATGGTLPLRAAAADRDDGSFKVVTPDRWLPSRGRECSDFNGLMSCNGPRRVAQPWGKAAQLASKLGLGTVETVLKLMRNGPPRAWVDQVDGEPTDAFRWAVEGGKLWRGFGYVRRERTEMPHNGVDIGAPEGTPIVAVANGLVGYSDNTQPGYGNMMLVVHADGSVAVYAHCKAAYAFPGQKVVAGDVIGEVGWTGIAKGAHLHFELRVKGTPRDPLPYFTRGSIEGEIDVEADGGPEDPQWPLLAPDGGVAPVGSTPDGGTPAGGTPVGGTPRSVSPIELP
jgi:hypothetical protein